MSTQAVVPAAPISQFFSFSESARAAGDAIGLKPSESPKQDFPDEVKAILQKPLPNEALSQAPRGLTSIKAIFVMERLNLAFGLGRWFTTSTLVERIGKDVVCHTVLHLTDYPWFYAEAFGGNSNVDLGDAYKGAVTDGVTKIAAQQLEIGKDVYKGQGNAAATADEKKDKAAEAAAKKTSAATPAAATTTATAEVDPATKKAAVAAETAAARETVANPPDCTDCQAPIKTWTHPTNSKVYDAADLIKNSEKKYGLGIFLCAECQATRAKALKDKSNVAARTQ